MAKEADVQSVYDMIKIVPGAAGAAGEVLQANEIYGFLLEAITAAEVALSEERTLIVGANLVLVQKTTGQAWVAGEAIYWDASTSKFTNVKGVLPHVGYVWEAAASADTTGMILFTGVSVGVNGMLARSGIAAVTGTLADIDTGLSLIVEVLVSIKDTTQGAGDAAYATYDHGADGLLDLYCWDDVGVAATVAANVAWLALGN